MPYITYDNTGTQNGSGGQSGGGGGGSSTPAYAKWNMGSFWANTGSNMPTADQAMYGICVTSGAQLGAIDVWGPCVVGGSVMAVSLFCNGSTGGVTVYGTLYKNGVAQGLVASGTTSGRGNISTPLQAKGAFSFVAGDYLQVYIRGASSGVNQSFTSYLTVAEGV